MYIIFAIVLASLFSLKMCNPQKKNPVSKVVTERRVNKARSNFLLHLIAHLNVYNNT